MKKILFLPLLAALLMAACGDSEDDTMPQNPEPILLEGEDNQPDEGDKTVLGDDTGEAVCLCEGSPISKYFEPGAMTVFWGTPSSDGSGTCLFSFFWCSKFVDGESKIEPICRKNSDNFKDYAAYYGDTTYSALHPIGKDYEVSAMPLNSISITADKDFDAEHPAGSLLNDLFVLQYASAYNLIKSGYDDDINICRRHAGSLDAYQVMPLSEFEPINLMHYQMNLYFTKLPETLGEYTFTISFEYGADPVSGKEGSKIAPAVVKAVFTEADYVNVPVHEPLNKGE